MSGYSQDLQFAHDEVIFVVTSATHLVRLAHQRPPPLSSLNAEQLESNVFAPATRALVELEEHVDLAREAVSRSASIFVSAHQRLRLPSSAIPKVTGVYLPSAHESAVAYAEKIHRECRIVMPSDFVEHLWKGEVQYWWGDMQRVLARQPDVLAELTEHLDRELDEVRRAPAPAIKAFWLRGARPAASPEPVGPRPCIDGDDISTVTLDQAAAMVSRCKRTLLNYELPPPDIKGGGGRPNEWYWKKTMRPWLEKHFNRSLPEKRPQLPRA